MGEIIIERQIYRLLDELDFKLDKLQFWSLLFVDNHDYERKE